MARSRFSLEITTPGSAHTMSGKSAWGFLATNGMGLCTVCAYVQRTGIPVGARTAWKGLMEGRLFLRTFGGLPEVAAHRSGSDARPRKSTQKGTRSMPKHVGIYRFAVADRLEDTADLVIFGHVHVTRDDRSRVPRMLVLGPWHTGASYLRVDADGATFVIEPPGP